MKRLVEYKYSIRTEDRGLKYILKRESMEIPVNENGFILIGTLSDTIAAKVYPNTLLWHRVYDND